MTKWSPQLTSFHFLPSEGRLNLNCTKTLARLLNLYFSTQHNLVTFKRLSSILLIAYRKLNVERSNGAFSIGDKWLFTFSINLKVERKLCFSHGT